MEQLKAMKQQLLGVVQGQLGRIESVDAKELGEAIDMIKDLAEAEYYCTIVKSMEESDKEPKFYPYPMYNYNESNGSRYYRDMDRDMGRMYYDDFMMPMHYTRGGNSSSMGNGSRNYQDGNRQSQGESRNYMEREYPIQIRDYREGRSPMSRRNYMENKEMHKDKAVQMQELEKYMQELGHDITEMIEGASPEEKQILQKKLTALATKIV